MILRQINSKKEISSYTSFVLQNWKPPLYRHNEIYLHNIVYVIRSTIDRYN